MQEDGRRGLFLLPSQVCISPTAADGSGASAWKCVLGWEDRPQPHIYTQYHLKANGRGGYPVLLPPGRYTARRR